MIQFIGDFIDRFFQQVRIQQNRKLFFRGRKQFGFGQARRGKLSDKRRNRRQDIYLNDVDRQSTA